MQKWLKYANDADWHGWWVPFACLGLTVGAICVAALTFKIAVSSL